MIFIEIPLGDSVEAASKQRIFALQQRIEAIFKRHNLEMRRASGAETTFAQGDILLVLLDQQCSPGKVQAVCTRAEAAEANIALLLLDEPSKLPWLAFMSQKILQLPVTDDDAPLLALAKELGGSETPVARAPVESAKQETARQTELPTTSEAPTKKQGRVWPWLMLGGLLAGGIGYAYKTQDPCQQVEKLGYRCDQSGMLEAIKSGNVDLANWLVKAQVKLDNMAYFNLFVGDKFSTDMAGVLQKAGAVESGKACLGLLNPSSRNVLAKVEAEAHRRQFVRTVCGAGEFPGILDREIAAAKEALQAEKLAAKNPGAACVATLKKEFPATELNALRGKDAVTVQSQINAKIGNRMTVPAEFSLVPKVLALMNRGASYEQATLEICRKQGAVARGNNAELRINHLLVVKKIIH